MADIKTEEGWLATEDGVKLYTKTWKVEAALTMATTTTSTN
jgi:hypothetical protein